MVMTREEVGRIIDLQRSEKQSCATVIDLLDRQLGDVDRKLADLKTLRRTLAAARA